MTRTPSATARAAAARKTRLAVAAGLALGMVASGALVWRGTEAAFTQSTTTTASWTTGTVTIGDDDVAGATFSATRLTTGSTDVKCIAVTYSGSNAAQVRLYATNPSGPELSPYVTLTVEEGTGGTSASCATFSATSTLYAAGPLSTFQTTYTNHGNGLSTWNPTGASSDTRSYRITYKIEDSAPQGKSAGLTFTWEARG